MIDRRGFLVLSAGVAAGVVGACSSRAAEPASAEQAARPPGFDIGFTPAETAQILERFWVGAEHRAG